MESINNCKIFNHDVEVCMDDTLEFSEILNLLQKGISSENIICFDKNEIINTKTMEVNMKETTKSQMDSKEFPKEIQHKNIGDEKLICTRCCEDEKNMMPVIITILILYFKILK